MQFAFVANCVGRLDFCISRVLCSACIIYFILVFLILCFCRLLKRLTQVRSSFSIDVDDHLVLVEVLLLFLYFTLEALTLFLNLLNYYFQKLIAREWRKFPGNPAAV